MRSAIAAAGVGLSAGSRPVFDTGRAANAWAGF
jgi:hypothetical protein